MRNSWLRKKLPTANLPLEAQNRVILFHCPLDGERFSIIAVCGFVAMLLINIFSLKISSIALMLVAGAVSLGLFLAKGAPEAKGGGTK